MMRGFLEDPAFAGGRLSRLAAAPATIEVDVVTRDSLSSKHLIAIAAPPTRILNAFFDPAALSVWWQAARSVTVPRGWDLRGRVGATEFRDDVLGRSVGFHGTVMDHKPGREFVANAYWLPPEEPIGRWAPKCPASFSLSERVEGPPEPRRKTPIHRCAHARQFAPCHSKRIRRGRRWRRYYSDRLADALESLKRYMEK
jgi:hypothetical protein